MPPNLRVEKQKALMHVACISKDTGWGNLGGRGKGGQGEGNALLSMHPTPTSPLS